ncbi:pyridoxamine 5'-phosphate oxidase family protein [Streptosporangium sp. H16]|uniref:pyridoxamine 5'-phosphate oxidase family protein n=1 Tax=Streptosporangium sp. H16 TaxID=3444184 RepID=UPI003F79399E
MSVTGTARGVGLPPARDLGRRRADVLERLATDRHAWLATGGTPDAHLVPLGCVWDGVHLVMATQERHRTVRNLRGHGFARAALGSPADVVLIDGPVEIVPYPELPADAPAILAELPVNPSRVPGCVYLFLTPRRVLAWRHRGEIPGRTVMKDGRWLA